MRRLLDFLKSVYLFLLFVVLEGSAIYIYANSDGYTRAKLLGYSASIVGTFGSMSDSVMDYFSLKERNEMLLQRVAELQSEILHVNELQRSSLEYSYAESDMNQTMAVEVVSQDTLYAKSSVGGYSNSYMAARVVSNTVGKVRNYMVIDRGLKHGVDVGMGVITPMNEVVGVVLRCTNRYSVIMSILNVDFQSSGEVLGDKHAGAIYWDGRDRYRLKMRDLSKYADLSIGATIVTTGFSQIFPAGVIVGSVAGYELDAEQRSYLVDIDILTEVLTVSDVLVVNDMALMENRRALEEFGGDAILGDFPDAFND